MYHCTSLKQYYVPLLYIFKRGTIKDAIGKKSSSSHWIYKKPVRTYSYVKSIFFNVKSNKGYKHLECCQTMIKVDRFPCQSRTCIQSPVTRFLNPIDFCGGRSFYTTPYIHMYTYREFTLKLTDIKATSLN